MNLFLAITDNDWFGFLRRRPEVDEVNFWRPHGRVLRALRPGEALLFKLKSPRNFVAGGGFFAHASVVPASLAWEAFGERNGAATYDELRRRIESLRGDRLSLRDDPEIGCVILVQPFFPLRSPRSIGFRSRATSSCRPRWGRPTTRARARGASSGSGLRRCSGACSRRPWPSRRARCSASRRCSGRGSGRGRSASSSPTPTRGDAPSPASARCR